MRKRTILLASASLVYSSPHSFSVTDDLLAYPQYEVVFSDSYISDEDASSQIAYASSQTSDEIAGSSPSLHPYSSASSSYALTQHSHAHTTGDATSSSNHHAQSPPPIYEHMILNSTPYLCSIPPPPPIPQKSDSNATRAQEDETAELARATDRGTDLLKPMSSSCLYFISGWWSYQFCYAQSVKQFHQLPPGKNIPMFPPVEDPTTPSYVLGKFGEKSVNRHRLSGGSAGGALDGGLSAEAGEDEGSTTTVQAKGSASSKFLSQKLGGGTTCDLTGAPRRVEIQFHCHPQSSDRIGYIKEVSTCSYLMVVYTPRLCNDVAFLPEREEKAEEVVCKEVVKEEDIDAWKKRKSMEGEQALISQVANSITDADAGRVMIGDIEVGGMKLVGGDKGYLQPPNLNSNAGKAGQKDVKVGSDGKVVPKGQVIAHQHKATEGGAIHRMTDKEMRDLGVNLKTAQAAMKELQEMSGKKGWRLEVYYVDGELQMRGIVDEDDPEEQRKSHKGSPDNGDDAADGRQEPEIEVVDIVILDHEDEVGQDNQRHTGAEGQEEEGSQEEYKDEL